MSETTNLPTSPASRAGSPDLSIDALFEQFALMYGKHWLEQWVGMPVGKVKAAWHEKLCDFQPQTLRLAIDHMHRTGQKFPPTLPEFYSLCYQFRPARPAPLQITERHESGPIPESVKAKIEKLLNRRS